METIKEFKIAGISNNSGVLEIDSTASTIPNVHYNVKVVLNGDKTITVTGDRVRIGVSFSSGNFSIDDITEDSIETYKFWPWSKPKKRSKNIVEYKKRIPVNYTSNNYILIE